VAIRGTAYIYVTGVAEREGDQWVSFCKELGTASCGDTPEEALANLDEAVQVYLETLAEYGELDRVLDERGIMQGPTSSCSDSVGSSP
jgi:predicted RNase H-like HicB family nuclease